MSKTKATHCGECQLCGRKQKLPGNTLSLHGYTKEWGFFNGTCPGSRFLPYEKSCGEITNRIPQVESDLIAQETRIAELAATPMPADECWVHLYIKSNNWREKSGYRWIEASVRWTTEGRIIVLAEYTDTYGNPKSQEIPYHGPRDVPANRIATDLYVKELERRRAEIASYLKWLKDRESSWTLQPLTPVNL